MKKELSKKEIENALSRFALDGEVRSYAPYGSGHINDTYLVEANRKYILQRMNTNIFKNPRELMENVSLVCDFMEKEIRRNGGDPEREGLRLIPLKVLRKSAARKRATTMKTQSRTSSVSIFSSRMPSPTISSRNPHTSMKVLTLSATFRTFSPIFRQKSCTRRFPTFITAKSAFSVSWKSFRRMPCIAGQTVRKKCSSSFLMRKTSPTPWNFSGRTSSLFASVTMTRS